MCVWVCVYICADSAMCKRNACVMIMMVYLEKFTFHWTISKCRFDAQTCYETPIDFRKCSFWPSCLDWVCLMHKCKIVEIKSINEWDGVRFIERLRSKENAEYRKREQLPAVTNDNRNFIVCMWQSSWQLTQFQLNWVISWVQLDFIENDFH